MLATRPPALRAAPRAAPSRRPAARRAAPLPSLPRRPVPRIERRLAVVTAAAADGAAATPPPPTAATARRALAVAAAAAGLAGLAYTASPGGGPLLSSLAAAAGVVGAKLAVTSAVAKSAWAGLAAGCLHTLSGPDHLAALTPLTVGRSHTAAAVLGGLWGFGHCVGQLVLGLAMVLLKDRFTSFVPALSKYGSATVGGTLLAIGAVGLYETWAAASEAADADAAAAPPPPPAAKPGSSGWTLAAGVVYGLQPDALFVIVPALALPSAAAAAAYMAAFVAGTVGAMGSYAAAIGAASRAVADATRSARAVARLSAAASVVALVAGAVILAGACGVGVPFVSFVAAAH